jgi:hypothetical protein
MTIYWPDTYLRSIWDWKILDGCFPRGIRPTDIDGWVELCGYFLVLEGKGPGVPVPEGQRRAFNRMHRWNQIIPGLFTIIVIWGDAATGCIEELQFWPSAPIKIAFNGNTETLRSYVTAWADSAEARAATEENGAWVEVDGEEQF